MISTHASTPPSMRDWLDRQLNASRRWLALGAAIGAMGAWAAIPVLSSSHQLPTVDFWLHVCSGLVLTGSVAWLLLSRGSVLKFSIILLVAEALLITIRMSVGFLTADPSQNISEALPPLSPWVPLIFVVGFMLLPVREALYFSCVHMFVLMISALVFVTQIPALVGHSYEMLNIALQYVCMHPLLVLLLYLIFTIHNQQRQALQSAYLSEASLARRLEQDDRQDGLSRSGFLNLLAQTLENLKPGDGAVLIECRIEVDKIRGASSSEDAIENAVQALLSRFRRATDIELSIGRLDTDRILLIWHKWAGKDVDLEALAARLQKVADSCQLTIGLRVVAIRLEPGMTPDIAIKTLELMTLQPHI